MLLQNSLKIGWRIISLNSLYDSSDMTTVQQSFKNHDESFEKDCCMVRFYRNIWDVSLR